MNKKEMTYQQAREELDAIVAELEQPDAPLTQIAPKMERASVLVSFCRDYLHRVQENAEGVLSKIQIEEE